MTTPTSGDSTSSGPWRNCPPSSARAGRRASSMRQSAPLSARPASSALPLKMKVLKPARCSTASSTSGAGGEQQPRQRIGGRQAQRDRDRGMQGQRDQQAAGGGETSLHPADPDQARHRVGERTVGTEGEAEAPLLPRRRGARSCKISPEAPDCEVRIAVRGRSGKAWARISEATTARGIEARASDRPAPPPG